MAHHQSEDPNDRERGHRKIGLSRPVHEPSPEDIEVRGVARARELREVSVSERERERKGLLTLML